MRRLFLRKALLCRLSQMSGLSSYSSISGSITPITLSSTLKNHPFKTSVRHRHRHNSYPSESVCFRLRRNPSLLDEPVSIHASGLPANTPVTLGVKLFNEKEKLDYTSVTHYVTNAEGILDLDLHEYTCGKYRGVDGMAPFWMMKPRKSEWQDRLLVRDVTQPLVYNLQLFLGKLSEDEVFPPNDSSSSTGHISVHKTKLLASCDCERQYMADGVERIPIAEDGIYGTLFLPPKQLDGETFQCPRPLIINLYGGIHKGGLIEEKAALLASRGFATFIVGFFGIGTLPKRYGIVDIEYFEKAIKMVCQKYPAQIDSSAIGMIGISKAGDITLSCAAFLPNLIKAVIVINCCLSSVGFPTLYKDQRVEGLDFDKNVQKLKITDDGMIDILGIMNDVEANPDSVIPFAKSPVDILWFAGDDDHNFDSAMYARMAVKLAAKEGKMNFEHHIFPGCGHLVDLPFSPPATSSLHPLAPPGVKLYMGGSFTIKEHVAAQVHIWRKSLDFFRQKLLKGELQRMRPKTSSHL